MENASTDGSFCRWKGKHLPDFALGHIHKGALRIQACSSPRYVERMLSGDVAVVTEVHHDGTFCKDRITSILIAKFSYIETIPLKVYGK